MEFESAKTLFGVGLLLQLISPLILGSDFGIVYIIGLVLALIGLNSVADAYSRPDIFRNYLYAAIIGIVGIIALVFVFAMIFAVIAIGSMHGVTWMRDGWDLSEVGMPLSMPWHMTMGGALIMALLFLVSIWAVAILSMHFERRAYLGLAEVSGVDHFKTAATLIWIGAWLTIVLVGFLLIFIGEILAVVGAFSLKPPRHPQQPAALA